jgi:phenylacetyl-CoA:acceptor oxidoreductase subunit 2
MSYGPAPWQQTAWDHRAAANFVLGGAGSGLVLVAALASLLGHGPAWPLVAGAAAVAAGLAAVWAEIGRPWRALNVFFNPRTSWMTREALVAPLLILGAGAAAMLPRSAAGTAAAVLAVAAAPAFAYCQARILRAARGIPAWRAPGIVVLIVTTSVTEGLALWMLLGGHAAAGVWAALLLALALRQWAWMRWRAQLAGAQAAARAVDGTRHIVQGATLAPMVAAVLALGAPLPPAVSLALQAGAAALALAGGLWFKFTLITRAGINQGFAIAQLPVRGARRQES